MIPYYAPQPTNRAPTVSLSPNKPYTHCFPLTQQTVHPLSPSHPTNRVPLVSLSPNKPCTHCLPLTQQTMHPLSPSHPTNRAPTVFLSTHRRCYISCLIEEDSETFGSLTLPETDSVTDSDSDSCPVQK